MASKTALQIITNAFRKLKILASEEPLGSAEAVDALESLNMTMHGFGPRGIAYAHTDLALTDTVNMPDELQESLILMLADDLAEDYGVQISPKLAADIIDAKNMLQAAYHVQAPAAGEPMLRPHYYGRFDITRLE